MAAQRIYSANLMRRPADLMRWAILPRWKLLLAILAGLLLAAATRLPAQQGGQDSDGAYAMGSQGRMVRGEVTAASGDHLTVKTTTGEIYQVVVTTNTRVTKDRQPVKVADIHPGDGVGAMGVVDPAAKTVHAAVLFVMDAAQIKKAKEDMGKTYITGKVTGIDDVVISVHRSDGVDQKITVDETTSFKKGGRGAAMALRGDGMGGGMGGSPSASPGDAGGESITLADIKVGDFVGGPGALKSGVFVPTQLTVVDAAAMARRRRPEGGAATPTANTPTATGPTAAAPQ
jgi:hypothetical protein